MRGDVDMAHEVNRESVEFLEGASRVEMYRSIQPFYIPLVFNLHHPILGRVEVRRAIAEAINRTEIVERAMRGHGQVADDPVWPSHWAYNPAARRYTYNPAAARVRLDAAGLPVRPAEPGSGRMASRFQITCVFFNEDPQFERIALMLQRQLAAVGHRPGRSRARRSRALVTRAAKRDFDCYLCQLRSGRSFDWTYRRWHSPERQRPGFAGLRLPRRRRGPGSASRTARTDAESASRSAILRQRFYEDVPAVFLAWHGNNARGDARFDVGDRTDPESSRICGAGAWLRPISERPRDETDHLPLRPAHRDRRDSARSSATGWSPFSSLRTGTEESVSRGQPGRRAVRSPNAISLYFDNSRRVLASIGTEFRGTQLAQWQQERILRNHVLDFPEFREISVFDDGGRSCAASRVGGWSGPSALDGS